MPIKPARVLIVDDDVDSTDLLKLLVEQRGHEARIAHDVDDALRVAREFQPDVALLDIMIRCESGYFLARELRGLVGLGHCRLVAMTGFAQEQHRQASQAAGFERYLTKPIDPQLLFDAVEAFNDPEAFDDPEASSTKLG